MKHFTLLFVLLLIIQGLGASDNSNVAATVYGCHGDTITLPFSSHVDVQKIDVAIMSVHFQGKTIATLVDGLTSSVSSYRPRIRFMDNGNFILENADINDTGSYSLNVRNNVGKVKASIFIDLLVTNKVMYKGTQMVAQLSNKAEWNSDTESFTLSLTCGVFILKNDNAPIDVEWITPDGIVKNSTKYNDGKFYLQLDNPVKGGQYVCKIPEKSLSTVCATSNDNTRVAVDVNEDKAQIILLESKNQKLNEKLNNQDNKIDNLITSLTASGCEDWNSFKSGKRMIHLANSKSIKIYCDQDTDGGRWNVFQRRKDGSVDFLRGWSDYRQGFGDPDKEFWLGLETLHQMTKDGRNYELRFDLEKQDGSKYYAVYDDFSIGSESEGYAVHFTGYRGNAGDSFTSHKDMKFSTEDRDNDITTNSTFNCAAHYLGGWWYEACHQSKLNGHYNDTRPGKGLNWSKLTPGYKQSLKKTEIKFRVKQ